MKKIFYFIIMAGLAVYSFTIPVLGTAAKKKKKNDGPPQKDYYYKNFDNMDEHFEKTIDKEMPKDEEKFKRRPKKS